VALLGFGESRDLRQWRVNGAEQRSDETVIRDGELQQIRTAGVLPDRDERESSERSIDLCVQRPEQREVRDCSHKPQQQSGHTGLCAERLYGEYDHALGNVRDVQPGSATEHSSRWELILSHTPRFQRDYLGRAIKSLHKGYWKLKQRDSRMYWQCAGRLKRPKRTLLTVRER